MLSSTVFTISLNPQSCVVATTVAADFGIAPKFPNRPFYLYGNLIGISLFKDHNERDLSANATATLCIVRLENQGRNILQILQMQYGYFTTHHIT